MLFFSKKFTIPSTKGFSGPTMIILIFSLKIKFFNSSKLFKLILMFVAILSVPALPGKQKIFFTIFDLLRLEQIECSLPPLPIIPIIIYINI